MKTTVKINLSGQIFTLDEDAYQSLKDYLDEISNKFRDMDEGNEIIADIEARIAELFLQKISEKKQVITIEDVKSVIEIMGHPEDFEDAGQPGGESSRRTRNGKRSRRLYRDPDNAVFGGVASGLAAYFGIEVWLMRLIWVIVLLATGGIVIILYIILWIAVPKAVTSAEKLEMRGEKVTVENIEKTVKEEYETVKENVKESYSKIKNSKELKKTKNVFEEIVNVIGQIILAVLKIIVAIIGFAFFIGGLAVLTGLSVAFFFRSAIFPVHFFGVNVHSFHELFGVIGDPASLTFISIALFLVIAIPLIALIYAGIKMLFRFKANDRIIGLMALVLWVISLIFIITLAVFEGWHFRDYGSYFTTYSLQPIPSDTLVVRINDDPGIEGFDNQWYFSHNEHWQVISGQNRIYSQMELHIEPAENGLFKIREEKKSAGRTYFEARMNAEKLDYKWSQEDGELILDPYFSLLKPMQWRSPETEITVLVPPGMFIRLDRNTRYFMENVKTVKNISHSRLAGDVWQMTEDGLAGIRTP